MTTTVAEAVAAYLAEVGARHVFAISGAANLRILDAIAQHPDLDYYCPHHEQAGVMAATMSGRLSGRLGVMLVTAGPGATNTVTGVASAFLDSMPVLIIGGQEPGRFFAEDTGLRGRGIQGLDMIPVLSSLTKYAVRISKVQDLRRELEKAVHAAVSGRPGPVWVEITQDVQAETVVWADLPGHRAEEPASSTLDAQATEFLAMLAAAERPLLWVGNGVRLAGAVTEFREVLERLGAPALVSWNGLDLLEDDHPLMAGRAGNYGQRAANFAVQNCDFVFALGTRLAIPQIGYVQGEFARAARKGLVEIDPSEIRKLSPDWDLAVQADVGDFLRAVLRQLKSGAEIAHRPAWQQKVAAWRQAYPPFGPEHHETVPDRVNSYHFIDRLSDALDENDVICTDMGSSLTCTHAALRVKRGQRVVTSTGLGEMGFGLPGAIGACIGAGRRRTILVGADGSLMMNLQELQTVVHHDLPLKIFILNNNGYLTIQHTERALFGDRFSGCGPETGVSVPDFGPLARALGFPHHRLHDAAQLDQFIAEVLSGPGPAFAEIMMPEDQFLGPKTAVMVRDDGSLYSPPLEDLAPLLPRDELARNMLIPMLEA